MSRAGRTVDVAVVGATGLVGESMLRCLWERQFPVGALHAVASERSLGKHVLFGQKRIPVQNLEHFDFGQVQLALFSAGGSVASAHGPRAAEAGCVVIDNSSAFRGDPDIPLVVPEVNAHTLEDVWRGGGIIANPNCSTIQLVVALKPIFDAVGLESVYVATYQSVSGKGQKGLEELAGQTAALLNGQEISPKAFSKQIAFNVLPEIDVFDENGFTKEELKVVNETRKILGDQSIEIGCTAVRVPVFFGHSEAVRLKTKQPLSAAACEVLLREAPGVVVLEDNQYPTAAEEGNGSDAVYVGRIREDLFDPHVLHLWVVADNVRKGAALNAVEIAELLLERESLCGGR